MNPSRNLTTDFLRQSFGEEDDDVSVIAVIQVDKDVPPKAVNPSQTSTATVQGAVRVSRSEGPEVILLDQRPVGQSCQRGETQHVNRRVIDLSDKKSKMALREQLRLESPTAEQSDEDGGIVGYGGMDILQKLPSDTVVIKRDARMQKEDSDYVRDSTETNSSGGSSSTSGYAAGKVKRIHRVMRSKNRNTVEVRRNPMRVTKKDTEKETSRSRQRLLSAKRKEAQAAPESKRVKLSTMPYMNTRSVTRKMYTVGAIYQAPTIKDMKEWKEWPVHGMHERPVFHPQVGLATEFMGRYFISLDGLSYREIVDHPGANTIAPDPYFNLSRPNRSCQENSVTLKVRNSTSKKASQDSSKEDKSFAGYMHRSLHYVLAYCAQVMTPAYRKNVRDKIRILQRDGTLPLMTNEPEQPNFRESKGGGLKRLCCEQNTSTVVSEQKRVQEQKQIDSCTVAMPQSVKELNQLEKAIRQPQTSMVYVADPQKNLIALKNVRSIRGGQLIFQDVRPIQKNSLVFVKAAGAQSASHSREQGCKTVSRDLNFTKLEDTAISDEALMEMSSVYTNFVPSDNAIPSYSSSMSFPRRVAPKIAVKPENLTVPKRVVIDRPYDRREKENQLRVSNYNVKNIGRVSETSTSSNTGTTWYTNDASEIAKILSEYNRSIARKSAIQNTFHVSPTNVQKPNLLRTSQRLGRLELQGNNELQGCSGQSFGLASQTAVKLSQDKWRRFYPTVEIVNEPTVSYKVGMQSGSLPTENPSVNLRNINQETITRYTKVDDNFCSSSSSSQQRQTFMKSIKPNVDKRECEKDTQKDSEKSAEMDALQELLENTAMLYCAATGTHQDDLANYIDSLDAKQSIQWLEMVDPAWS